MKIKVDFDACQSHAVCVAQAPEVFAVDDQGYLEIKLEEPGPELHEKVRAAERGCPTQAISFEESA